MAGFHGVFPGAEIPAVPRRERAAAFGRGVVGYSTKMMMTTTTTMTSAAIAMLRVLMATSVYLIAPGAISRDFTAFFARRSSGA